MSGPIQMVMIKFETTQNFHGEILEQLDALRGKGLIRLIDLYFVSKDENDHVSRMEMTDLSDEGMSEFGAVVGKLMGLEGDTAVSESPLVAAGTQFGLTIDDFAKLPDLLTPDHAAAILLFEHTWAAGFQAAVAHAGGHMTAQGFLTPELLAKVGKEVKAIQDAEAALEIADAIRGAAMLDALMVVAEVEAVEEAVIEEAVEVVAMAEAVEEAAIEEAVGAVVMADEIKTAVAADVLRTLVIAGMIEDAAVEEALDVLVAAELIEEAAIAEAVEVTAAMDAEVADAKARLAAVEAD